MLEDDFFWLDGVKIQQNDDWRAEAGFFVCKKRAELYK